MNHPLSPLNPPQRILMGPGPSDVPVRILQALAAPTLGHLDPEYLKVMDDLRQLLRMVFQTKNELTIAISGTGSAGMEACLCNLIEPGDQVTIGVAGVFGARMADVAGRYGAVVTKIEAPWGEAIQPEQVLQAFRENPKCKLFGIVQAETSTGLHQPLDEIAEIVHSHGALLVVDAVTSLGGMEVPIDRLGIDACYSGSQKNLSCPPGLAPVTFSPRATEAMDRRRTPVANWYLDLSMIRSYWGSERSYHHTAPINMTYALREACQMVIEEGLENRWNRHRRLHQMLRAGLESLGFTYIPNPSLPNLNCIRIPAGLDDVQGRKRLLEEFGIEIGAGLGPFKGKAWRIGLMGHACQVRNVVLVLSALSTLIRDAGLVGHPVSPLEAAWEAAAIES